MKRLSGLRRIRKCNDFVGVVKDRGRMRGLEVCKKSCHGSSVETESLGSTGIAIRMPAYAFKKTKLIFFSFKLIFFIVLILKINFKK